MPGLMLHAGADAINRFGLASLPVPQPRGARHFIRPFIEDVELVTDYLGTVGLTVKDEAFGVKFKNETPSQFFGVMEVAPKVLDGEYIPADFGLMLGLRGSYDESLPRGLAVGSRVFVCDNLAFSGEVAVSTKQTLNVNKRIPALLQRAIGEVPRMAELQGKRFAAYKNTKFQPRWGDAALVEMLRLGVLNANTIHRAVKEWDEPSHVEHVEDGRTVWTLHNAVTEAIKPSEGRANVLPAWERTTKLTKFLDGVVGLC